MERDLQLYGGKTAFSVVENKRWEFSRQNRQGKLHQ